ncbi:MAG: hypothetical protein FD166_2093 [Bacteroidetes bacterium]|nr:MAG: hypothetical protein FD166_2093 [Bacteroidota bacterium]
MDFKLFILSLVISQTVFSQNGSLTITSVSQRADGSGIVDVYFDLSGPENNYYISLEASFDAGSTYTPIDHSGTSGDLGPISAGSNKHLIWNGFQSTPNMYSTQTKLKVTAGTIPTYITDIDGNVYQTVMIGQQLWMKENLKTTRYRNGTSLVYPGNNNTTWQNNTTGAYAWYNNDISWKSSYGALYNWFAATNSNGLCPTGWHVPSSSEWVQLINYIGGSSGGGNKLKSCRQDNSPLGGNCNTSIHPYWTSNLTHFGTDDYGFSAFPGGERMGTGSFIYFGLSGIWWTSTQNNSSTAWYRDLGYNYGVVGSYYYIKSAGHSVRCVKD